MSGMPFSLQSASQPLVAVQTNGTGPLQGLSALSALSGPFAAGSAELLSGPPSVSGGEPVSASSTGAADASSRNGSGAKAKRDARYSWNFRLRWIVAKPIQTAMVPTRIAPKSS